LGLQETLLEDAGDRHRHSKDRHPPRSRDGSTGVFVVQEAGREEDPRLVGLEHP